MKKWRDRLMPCCGKMEHELDDATMVVVSNVDHFKYTNDNPPLEVQFISDGGHGGCIAIAFCPFCGEKIRWSGEFDYTEVAHVPPHHGQVALITPGEEREFRTGRRDD